LKCLDLFAAAASIDRTLYLGYAESLMQNRRSALVDIGYSATIQKALMSFLPRIAGGYYFVTVEQAADVERHGAFAKGCFGHHINAFHSDLPIYQFALLLESVMTAPHGQFTGFADDGGHCKPCFKAPGVGQKFFSELQEIHSGALEYLGDALDTSGELFISLGQHRLAANLPIRQVMEYRWKLGIETPALYVEDNYCGNDELSIFEFYDRKRERLPGVLD
jgi:hypothetical protein